MRPITGKNGLENIMTERKFRVTKHEVILDDPTKILVDVIARRVSA